MQLAAIPSVRAPGDWRGVTTELQAWRVDGARASFCIVREAQHNAILAALRRDLVQPQHDMPCAGAERPSQIRRSRCVWRNEERGPRAATPPAKTVCQKVRTALIEDTDIDRVAAGKLRVAPDLVAVFIRDIQAGDAGRHLERDQVI